MTVEIHIIQMHITVFERVQLTIVQESQNDLKQRKKFAIDVGKKVKLMKIIKIRHFILRRYTVAEYDKLPHRYSQLKIER